MFHASMRVAMVLSGALISGVTMSGCDGKTEAEPDMAKDRNGAAFEEELKGCAATAETLGQAWAGKAYAGLEAYLAANPPADVGSVRVIRPDTAVTKDYRLDRLNISLDDKEIVTKLYCG